MGIEYRGDGKFRFRMQKGGVPYSQNYFYSAKKLSKKDIENQNWPKEVRDAHAKFKGNILESNVGSNENMKFEVLTQKVIDDYVEPHRSINTLLSYRSNCNNYLLKYFTGMKISKITPYDIQKMVNELDKKHKPSTVKAAYKILNSIFNRAITWKFIKENPCKGVLLTRVEKTNYAELLPLDEIVRLFEAIDNLPLGKYKLAFVIAEWTGLRESEILGITLDGLDFKNNIIRIKKQWGPKKNKDGKIVKDLVDTKTKTSVRNVRVPKFVMNIISQYVSSLKVISNTKMLYWNVQYNCVLSRVSLTKQFKKLLKDNNIRDIKFHALRHLHATLALKSGIDIEGVAKRLGDTVQTIQSTYLHHIEDLELADLEQMENFVDSLKTTQQTAPKLTECENTNPTGVENSIS